MSHVKCPKCSNEMIQTRATNFGDDYYYCRNCKKELLELMPALAQEIEQQVINQGSKLIVKDEVWKLFESDRLNKV